MASLNRIREERRGIFLCCVYTMCRPGEARALLVEDDNFKTGHLRIHRALKTNSGAGPVRGGTETRASGVYTLPGSGLMAWALEIPRRGPPGPLSPPLPER